MPRRGHLQAARHRTGPRLHDATLVGIEQVTRGGRNFGRRRRDGGLRLGSDIGLGGGLHIPEENVEMSGNDFAVYEHTSDESNLKIGLHFCRRCGTTFSAKLDGIIKPLVTMDAA